MPVRGQRAIPTRGISWRHNGAGRGPCTGGLMVCGGTLIEAYSVVGVGGATTCSASSHESTGCQVQFRGTGFKADADERDHNCSGDGSARFAGQVFSDLQWVFTDQNATAAIVNAHRPNRHCRNSGEITSPIAKAGPNCHCSLLAPIPGDTVPSRGALPVPAR